MSDLHLESTPNEVQPGVNILQTDAVTTSNVESNRTRLFITALFWLGALVALSNIFYLAFLLFSGASFLSIILNQMFHTQEATTGEIIPGNAFITVFSLIMCGLLWFYSGYRSVLALKQLFTSGVKK